MKRSWTLLGLGLLLSLAPLACQQEDAGGSAEERPTSRLDDGWQERLRGQLRSPEIVSRLYSARADRPLFSEAQRADLLDVIQKAHEHGLVPARYHVDSLGSAANTQATDLDVVAADALVTLSSDLALGRVNPEKLEPDWRVEARALDLSKLRTAIDDGALPSTLVAAFAPRSASYVALTRALARYRSMNWEPLMFAANVELQKGASGPDVERLTRRLVAQGYLPRSTSAFEDDVEAAVRAFQTSHGVPATGVVAALTMAALDVAAAARVEQIELNLERLRWLPTELGERHIAVNIPAFELTVVERGAETLRMPIIVGRAYRRTPVFSAPLTDVVFNPSWGVPRRIATEDKLPSIKKDRAYLERNHLSVFKGNLQVDPANIDWAQVSAKRFPYQLRQSPGPHNALGRVKFNIRNEFDVYLHDTNEPELFKKSQRTLSSGCIRVAEPKRLAAAVLRWPTETVESAVAGTKTRRVLLPQPWQVHLLYQTAWVESDVVHFASDPYGRDKRLADAIARLR